MTTTLAGQPTSEQVRADLAADGRPVLLAFSRGKDSIAAWIALRDAGVEVVPFFLYLIPGLAFEAESLAYFEDTFGTRIARYPHPGFYRWLRSLVFPIPVMGGSTMAGVGPAPKDPAKRARRNAQPAQTVLPFSQCDQPDLPDGFPWPDATREWWQMWRSAPQSTLFGVTDWNFLLDTALIHADVWGNWNLDRMAELRIRVAAFGATPADRARLRISFADADEKDAKRPERAASASRERFADLRVLRTGTN